MPYLAAVIVLVLIFFLASLRLCNEWQRKVVLRLGRFTGVRGPGVFLLVPFVERTPFTLDMRVTLSRFVAEQTLTKDGASVTVDALLYWRIVDAGRASIQVSNYADAVLGAAQGALRDIIGRNDLATLLSQRRELDDQLTVILDEQTEPWGIKVQSVQLRDIKVPDALQDALSRMAQAERERQARIILGQSELAIAQLFKDAAGIYATDPTALHLRGMNMLYETMRGGLSSVIVVPSSAVDSMNLGALGGLVAGAQSASAAGRQPSPRPAPAAGTGPEVPPPWAGPGPVGSP